MQQQLREQQLREQGILEKKDAVKEGEGVKENDENVERRRDRDSPRNLRTVCRCPSITRVRRATPDKS